MLLDDNKVRKSISTSTVGRGKTVKEPADDMTLSSWEDSYIKAFRGNSLNFYNKWKSPTAIISDGAYGLLGFEGDTSDHLGIPEWYEAHIEAWANAATPQTTLWFWNSEIGWAAAHPILEKYGWRYVNANIWNKGKGHIAGNVNTQKIRRFPVVSEVCVQYVFEAKIDGMLLKEWLYREWKRTKLPMKRANDACGVKDVAVRKYLDQGHLWYYPPVEMFEKMQKYANEHGAPEGRPYFSVDGKKPLTGAEWNTFRSKFYCPHGVTNVWERNALRGKERFKINGSNGKAIHLNQKPLDLMTHIIEASTEKNDVIWEPFGGLFSASIAARRCGRHAYTAEIDPTYFYYACQRLIEESRQYPLP